MSALEMVCDPDTFEDETVLGVFEAASIAVLGKLRMRTLRRLWKTKWQGLFKDAKEEKDDGLEPELSF